MKKTIGLIFVSLIFVGCQVKEQEPKIEIANGHFFIPDSNKQKYAEFVSSVTKSCQEDCDDAISKAENVAGNLFGEQQYIIWYYPNGDIEYVYVSPSQMTEKQLELFHKTFKF